jgi:hypothetical protein
MKSGKIRSWFEFAGLCALPALALAYIGIGVWVWLFK